jgi:hypothetical protein
MANMTPIKNTSVDPETGNVIPVSAGTGPTNSMNDQTAATVQSQADQLAIKENRAGTPNNPASSAIQTPMTMKGNFKNSSIETAARMFGNVPNPVPSPQQFNSGLRKASADGELDGKFEKAVNAAPILKKKENIKGYIKESTSGRGTSYDQKKEGKTLKGGRKYKYYKDGKKVAVAKNHVSGFGKNKRLTGSTIDIK